MARKEFELAEAVLSYAAGCMSEGDWPALRDMGFGPQEAEALQELTFLEFAALARKLAGHVLQVQLDRTAFWVVMRQVRYEAARQRLRAEFIRADAPSDMMEALFGMGPKEYARVRRALGAPPGVGRPAEADEETARRIWLAWSAADTEPDGASPEQWLDVARQADAPLRTVWRLGQRWRDAGEGPSDSPRRGRSSAADLSTEGAGCL